MASLQKRIDKTLEYINDPDVTFVEGVIHSYLWIRFEMAIVKRNKAAIKAQKYADKLNINLEVFNFRKHMLDI